ncbi:uncharacterized protein RJT20DRAFT_55458 [Scheffersomyces xylosifermentans]|uniref:uncharacterized protein n=1 Tax=Scheffersomyces xylosifermentans TaxID=1304137 RepID=UPI00315CFCB5
MKRTVMADEDDSSPSEKKYKLQHEDDVIDFVSLPVDTQLLVFQNLERTDVINLSCVNSRYRSGLLHQVFRSIKTTWQALLAETKKDNNDNFFARFRQTIKQVRIIDCYSYGEFHIDIFTLLINEQKLPNLQHLLINTSNSSNWLKYRTNTNINELTLYYEQNHVESQDEFLTSNPKNINQLVRNTGANTSPRIFHLNHVSGFKGLTKLNLTKYHFNWEKEDKIDISTLRELRLSDCTWAFPFQLSQFNVNNSLKLLGLNYIRSNAFVLSERFNVFLLDQDDGSLGSVETIEIDISQSDFSEQTTLYPRAFGRVWSFRLFKKFINGNSHPRLRRLKCHGWLMNLQNFQAYLRSIERGENNLELLDILVLDPINDQFEEDMAAIKKEAAILFPRMKLKLKVAISMEKQQEKDMEKERAESYARRRKQSIIESEARYFRRKKEN